MTEETAESSTEVSLSFVDPKLDVVFRRLFGDERNKALLLSLLNGVMLHAGHPPLVEVELLNTGLEIEWLGEKRSVMDLKVRDEEGKLYNVEVQAVNGDSFSGRVLYYWSKLFGEQLKKGETYNKLRPVYSIIFTDFSMFDDKTRFHRLFQLLDRETQALLTDLLELHFIELPHFRKQPEKAMNLFERWLCFLQEGNQLNQNILEEWAKDNPEIREAMELLWELDNDEELRWEVLARREGIREWLSNLELQFEKGREEGREEGEQIGLQKGREEGREEGEQKARQALARKLSLAGQSHQEIAALLEVDEATVTIWLSRESS